MFTLYKINPFFLFFFFPKALSLPQRRAWGPTGVTNRDKSKS